MTTLLRKMWRNHSKHKKLSEEWALAECEGAEGWWGGEAGAGCGAGEARYAGCAAVERAASAPATARAVASALHVAKESNRKMQRVKVIISAKGIVATDAATSENVLNLSIYRISFCSADGASARVFAVVEGSGAGASGTNDAHTAHVFVCSRRKHARSFALALAHAFNDAYLAWQAVQDSRPTSSPALRIGQRRQTDPWVSFAEESDSDSDSGTGAGAGAGWRDASPAPAPLVTFD